MTSRRIVATLCLAALLLALVSPLGVSAWALPPPSPALSAGLSAQPLAPEPLSALAAPHPPEPTGRGPPARA